YRKVVEFLNLIANILAKHDADGVASVLTNIDMADAQTKYDFALAKHLEGEMHSFNREMATQERNLALGVERDQNSTTPGTILYYVTGIRDYLLGHFRGKEQSLGLWGYEVNTSSKKRVTVKISRNAFRLMATA